MRAITAHSGGIDCTGQTVDGSALVISVHHRLDDVRSVWERLQLPSQSSLHQSIQWCQAWYDTHGDQPLFVLGSENGRHRFLLPLGIRSRNGIKIARFPGRSFNNINTGLFDADFHPTETQQAEWVEQVGRALRGHADLLLMEAMPKEWRGILHPLHTLPAVEHINHSFQLPLLGNFEETLSQVNTKRRRKKFRQQTRRIEELGGYEVYSPASSEDQHTLLELFFQQKRERFRSHGLPDVFGDSQTQHFFHALLDAPCQANHYPLRLSSIRLKAGGERSIAAICGLSRKGDHVICQFGSIDESRVPETSPGELLFWHMIERSCEDGAKIFDFGLGDQLYKRSWCPIETIHYDYIIPISQLGRMAALAKRMQVQLKSSLKKNPVIYRLLQRLRAAKML